MRLYYFTLLLYFPLCQSVLNYNVKVLPKPATNSKYINPFLYRALNDIQGKNLIGDRRINIIYDILPNGTTVKHEQHENLDLVIGSLTKEESDKYAKLGTPTISVGDSAANAGKMRFCPGKIPHKIHRIIE